MKEIDLKELSVQDYFWYFQEQVEYLIKKTFNKNEPLIFVTYQPEILNLDCNEVKADTSILFNKCKYIEVLERTFKKSRMYNDGNYIDGYHSHIIMKESDFINIKDQMTDIDIVAKRVYDLSGLIKYLSKQVVLKYNRQLPTQHIPTPVYEPKTIITKTVKKPHMKGILNVIKQTIVDTVSTIKRSVFKPIQKYFKKPESSDDS